MLGLAVSTLLTEGGFSFVSVHELDLPDVFSVELPGVGLVNELELVWHLVCANLFDVEHVDVLGLGTDMELPLSVELAPYAVDWLISF